MIGLPNSRHSSDCSLDGVYKSGFATKPEAYEKAVKEVFDALDRLEKMLTGKDYLIGNQLTEADIRLYVTIVSAVFLTIIENSGLTTMCTIPGSFRPRLRRPL